MTIVRGSTRIIGEGEMADLIRRFDWSSTSLGAIETWPDILVTTVNMLLASRHPLFLWWGRELIQFYNDGYRPSIRADKHPSAIGQRGPECWPEIWSIIGPQIGAVMTRGESTWNINQLVPINRQGKLEEVYWTYSYSPIRDKFGVPQGTLVVCSETTEHVLSERRLRTLLAITPEPAIQDQPPESRPMLPFAQSLVATLNGNPEDVPFAALYLLTQGEITEAGSTCAVGRASDPASWPLAMVAGLQTPVLLEDLPDRVGTVLCPPWSEPVTRSYLLPLRITGSSTLAVLLLGISPRLPFDDKYETFFKLVGHRLAELLQSEIHQVELARAAKRFSGLVEANPFGMMIAGLDGSISFVNPALLETLGYTHAEVAEGKVRWDKLTPPEYAAADARAIEQIRNLGRCEVYEQALIAKNGHRVLILVGAAALRHSSSRVEVARFITDLTPLKKAEEALRTANEDLEKKVTERTAALEAKLWSASALKKTCRN